MSDNRRVIRVKDLVIKADNVYIEPQRRRDPFFGGVRGRRDDVESLESENVLESSSSSSSDLVGEDRDDRKDDDRRPPFSWI